MIEPAGQVITFYSYKGGTGRSMALANVACLLARDTKPAKNGHRVLMVDWDLEAPGLHRYFRDFLPKRKAALGAEHRSRGGVIDLFLELEERLSFPSQADEEEREELTAQVVERLNLDDYITPTTIDGLALLQAGRFDDSYSERVNRFDWEAFFVKAPTAITALSERLAREYPFVLVDSRTGHTDIQGICTTLLPDKLVLVFTPNLQSIHGVLEVGRGALEYRRSSDDLRPLGVFPLASRVEPQEPELRRVWRMGDNQRDVPGFQPSFERFFEDAYRPRDSVLTGQDPKKAETSQQDKARIRLALEHYFDEVQIQQMPKFAYGEAIAVLEESGQDRLSLSRSYAAFAQRLITLRGPWEEDAGHSEDIQHQLLGAYATRDAARARKAFVDRVASEASKWVGGLILAGLFGAGVSLYAAWDDASDTVEEQSRELEDLKKVQAKLDALKKQQENTAELAEKYEVLRQTMLRYSRSSRLLQRIDHTVRALEQFVFPPRNAKLTPELREKVQAALGEFKDISESLAKQQRELETTLRELSAPDAQTPPCPEGEDCPTLDIDMTTMLAEALAEMHERSQVVKPALETERDFWQGQLKQWAMPDEAEGVSPQRRNAGKVWEEGYAAYLSGNHDRAEELYQRAKELDPSWAPPYNSLGVLELARGKHEASLGWFDAALTRDSNYAPALSNKALAYIRLATRQPAATKAREKLLTQAQDAANAALKIRPGFSSPKDSLFRIRQLREAEKQEKGRKPRLEK